MNKNVSNVIFSISYFGGAMLHLYLIYSIFSSSGEVRDVSGLALMLIFLAYRDGLNVSRFYSNPSAEQVFYSNEMIASGWYFLVAFLCAFYVHFEFKSANIYSYIIGFLIYKFARVIFIKNLAKIFR